jgi:hypothetical protein
MFFIRNTHNTAKRVKVVEKQHDPKPVVGSEHVTRAEILFVMCFLMGVAGIVLERLYIAKNSVFSKYKKYIKLAHGLGGVVFWGVGKIQLWRVRARFVSIAAHYPLNQFIIASSCSIALALFLEIRK